MVSLEARTQLSTASEIFSDASTAFSTASSTQAAPADLALPGVSLVLNKGAVERAIVFGLVVGIKIAPKNIFTRKNYFYPDLSKGYQINQYEIPMVQDDTLTLQVEGKNGQPGYEKTVQLMRIHLEEDTNKSLHEDFADTTGIDLNHTDTPLLETMTKPGMHSVTEAAAHVKTLHALMMWLGIYDGNVQEDSFRCNTNVSVRRGPDVPFDTCCEIKNFGSFRFPGEAINYEVRRQIELIENGGTVMQGARLYDPDRKEMRSIRSREDTQDYRYLPDPDLLPLVIGDDWVGYVRTTLPELLAAMVARSESVYGLSKYDISILTAAKATAAYLEAVVAGAGATNAKTAANWAMGEAAPNLNRADLDIGAAPVSPVQLAKLLARIADSTISNNTAKEGASPTMWVGEYGGDTGATIAKKGLKQMSGLGELEKIIDNVLATSAKLVGEFRAGKEKAFNALVGQAMKATCGEANPTQVSDLLKKRLSVA